MRREAPKKLCSSNEGNAGEPRSKTYRMGGNLQNVGWLLDVGLKKLFPGMWYKLIWTLLWKCLALLLLLDIYTYDLYTCIIMFEGEMREIIVISQYAEL